MSEWTVDVDRRIYKGIQSGMDRGFIQKGDPVIIITGWKPGSGSTNTMRIINAVDVANKDLLAPITGITSVPSFHKIESDLSNKSSETSLPDSTKGSKDDVKFF